MKLDPDSDQVPPHEWRRRRQTPTRSANGASFAANMLGVRLSRQLIPNNAKLPFLPPLEQCSAGKSDFPVWFDCFPSRLNSQLHFRGGQLDYPSHVSLNTKWGSQILGKYKDLKGRLSNKMPKETRASSDVGTLSRKNIARGTTDPGYWVHRLSYLCS